MVIKSFNRLLLQASIPSQIYKGTYHCYLGPGSKKNSKNNCFCHLVFDQCESNLGGFKCSQISCFGWVFLYISIAVELNCSLMVLDVA